MIGIYMFTNKSNFMSYIGQSANIERRFKEHKSRKNELTYFHSAIREYGFDNFSFQILEECSVAELNEKEIYYIKEYNTLYPNGYNVSSGGDSSHVNALTQNSDVDEIIRLLRETELSNIEIGKLFNVSDQTISDINCGRTWVNDKYDYPIRPKKQRKIYYCTKCSKEIDKNKTGLCRSCLHTMKSDSNLTLKAADESKKNRIDNFEIKRSELYELLSTHSFTYVANLYNVSTTTVRRWCDKIGIPNNSKFYKNKKQNGLESKIKNTKNVPKPVDMLDLNGEYIRSFESAYKAAEFLIHNDLTNCKLSTIKCHIADVCKNQNGRKTAAGYKWRYITPTYSLN